MSNPVGADEPEVMDVMVRSFVTAEPEDTLGELAERLAAADAGSALVVEYGRLIGIVTSRDIVRAVGGRVHPSEGRMRHWMSDEPVVAAPDLPAEEAARLMVAGGFHHLPVVVEERPVGLVGLRTVVGLLRHAGPGW
jgi:CBS domain-containing protein